MKKRAFLKRITGSLKIALPFLVLSAAIGGTASFIWLTCKSVNDFNEAFKEARESPEIKEIIDKDLATLQEKLDNNEITMQEYREKKNYWYSDAVLKSYLEEDKEGNKYYLDKINKSTSMTTAGITLSILYPGIMGTLLLALQAEEIWGEIIESGKDDLSIAKRIAEEKKRNKRIEKECDEYKEELE